MQELEQEALEKFINKKNDFVEEMQNLKILKYLYNLYYLLEL